MRRTALILVVALPVLGLTGCSSARYVQCQQSGGIVAIPDNSNVWPSYNHDRAEELIRRKCPSGYEIVKEEEYVTGQSTYTDVRSDTQQAPVMQIGGANGSESSAGNRTRFSESLSSLAVPLGETRQTTHQATTARDITEWRIYYRAK